MALIAVELAYSRQVKIKTGHTYPDAPEACTEERSIGQAF